MADSLTLQTVLDAVQHLEKRLDKMDSRVELGFTEQRVLVLEVRTGFAEMRADYATLRNDVQDVRSRLTTLFDELAAFRQDFLNHGHGA